MPVCTVKPPRGPPKMTPLGQEYPPRMSPRLCMYACKMWSQKGRNSHFEPNLLILSQIYPILSQKQWYGDPRTCPCGVPAGLIYGGRSVYHGRQGYHCRPWYTASTRVRQRDQHFPVFRRPLACQSRVLDTLSRGPNTPFLVYFYPYLRSPYPHLGSPRALR